MSFFCRIVVALFALFAAFTASAPTSAAATVPTDPDARAAFIAKDRAALLQRIHPRWRDFQPQWREEICPFRRVARYDSAKVTCGHVMVPENRRDPESRLIRIAVSKVRTIAKGKPPADAIVYLSGGPGGPSAEGAAMTFPDRIARHRAFLELGDFYYVDQRGVGFSDAPLCQGQRDIHAIPTTLAAARSRFERIRLCLEEGRRRGIAVDAYTTWDNALDFRDIRRALGLPMWNLFGVSYGTELGQMILRVDGEGVRAAVLDSVLAPRTSEAVPGVMSAGFLSGIRKLNEACAADLACANRYGDLEVLARKAVLAYDAAPYTIKGLDPEIQAGGELVVNGALVAKAIFQALYIDDFYPAVPALIEALATRKADAALATYLEVLAPPAGHDFGHGMQTVANCSGMFGQRSGFAGAKAGSEPFWSKAMLDQAEEETCAAAGRPPADPLDALTPLVTDRPVLLMAGGVDPITPPWEAEAVKAALPAASYVLVPWAGHGVVRSDDCAGVTILSAFFTDPAKTPDLSCVAGIAPPRFVVDYKPTSGPITLFRAYEDGAATGPLAWLGASLALPLIGVTGFAWGPAARRIDGRTVVPAGGARRAAVVGALLGLGGAGLIGWAVKTTVTEHMLLAPLGLAGPAQAGGWFIIAGAAVSVAAILLLVRTMTRARLPIGTILGIAITAAATLALAAFAGTFGLL